jgi:hypothetical protein
MNCPLFRSNMTGATNEGGTAHSSQVTRRLLLVEKRTAHSSKVIRRMLLVEEELPTLQK